MGNFNKITGHLYKVKNQNGLNAALYEYFSVTDDGNNYTRSKKEVREMVQNAPPYYPITMVIIDQSSECNRVYLEFFDLEEQAHMNQF